MIFCKTHTYLLPLLFSNSGLFGTWEPKWRSRIQRCYFSKIAHLIDHWKRCRRKEMFALPWLRDTLSRKIHFLYSTRCFILRTLSSLIYLVNFYKHEYTLISGVNINILINYIPSFSKYIVLKRTLYNFLFFSGIYNILLWWKLSILTFLRWKLFWENLS